MLIYMAAALHAMLCSKHRWRRHHENVCRLLSGEATLILLRHRRDLEVEDNATRMRRPLTNSTMARTDGGVLNLRSLGGTRELAKTFRIYIGAAAGIDVGNAVSFGAILDSR